MAWKVMGTFHACGNTWRYDLKNINQRKSQIFLSESLSYANNLDARQSGCYAEKWSSMGKIREKTQTEVFNVIT